MSQKSKGKWRKEDGLRLVARAMVLNVPSVKQWVLAQDIWGNDPPAERTVQKWMKAMQGRNIDLVAAHGDTPMPRRTLTARRDAQHMRLSEHIQRVVLETRQREARHHDAMDLVGLTDGMVDEQGEYTPDGQAELAALTREYHGDIRSLHRVYVELEREYRQALTGVTVDDFSDDTLRSEIVGSMIEAADEFSRGEAERIIAALSKTVDESTDDSDDVL